VTTSSRRLLNRPDGDAGVPGKKPSAKKVLLALAQRGYRFGQDDSGRPFAVAKDGAPVVYRIEELMKLLAAQVYATKKMAVTSNAMKETATILTGMTLQEEPEEVSVRVGRERGGDILVDLGGKSGEFVRVNAEGWSIREDDRADGVLFSRTRAALPMPRPKPCPEGKEEMRLRKFRGLLNLDKASWDLLVGFMVTAFVPDIPHPILYITGVQGSAKSNCMEMVTQLIDATKAPKRSVPRDVRHWQQSAKSSYVVPLENVSHIQPWLSDLLCMAATGSGDIDRVLFTDDDAYVTRMRRVVIINGIAVTGIRSDMADRLLKVTLAPIGETARRTEREVQAAFEEMRGAVFGALLNVLAAAMRATEDGEATLSSHPRMADFAEWLRAVDIVRGTDSLSGFNSVVDELAIDIAENDLVVEYLKRYLSSSPANGSDKMRASEWVQQLKAAPIDMPGRICDRAESFSSALNRALPGLTKAGWSVKQVRSNGTKLWDIRLPEQGVKNAPKVRVQRKEGVNGSNVVQLQGRTGSHQGR
jgi:hypothetical protein